MSKKGSILIIDDQKSWRDLLKEILETDGHSVFTTNTYNAGKELLQKEKFDIAIIDMRLVDEDSFNAQGLSLLKEIRKYQTSTKAIILTGYPDEIQREKAMSLDAYDYLEKVPNGKPFDIDEFQKIVTSLL